MERNAYLENLPGSQLPVMEQEVEVKKPAVRPRKNKEDQMVNMDMTEFLTMASGGVFLGIGIYLLSFLG